MPNGWDGSGEWYAHNNENIEKMIYTQEIPRGNESKVLYCKKYP